MEKCICGHTKAEHNEDGQGVIRCEVPIVVGDEVENCDCSGFEIAKT